MVVYAIFFYYLINGQIPINLWLKIILRIFLLILTLIFSNRWTNGSRHWLVIWSKFLSCLRFLIWVLWQTGFILMQFALDLWFKAHIGWPFRRCFCYSIFSKWCCETHLTGLDLWTSFRNLRLWRRGVVTFFKRFFLLFLNSETDCTQFCFAIIRS